MENKHEFRFLYAPLAISIDAGFANTIVFQDATFAANTATKIFYKFDSYRFTYAYHFESSSNWLFAMGFSAKIRNAEVRVDQGSIARSEKNIGFVPLLNLQARYPFTNNWLFRFDFDGLAAPQGRAIDAAFFLQRKFTQSEFFGGYRILEGGADNKKVYNWALFDQAVLGLAYNF